jgi:hypothetical protein
MQAPQRRWDRDACPDMSRDMVNIRSTLFG